MRRLSVLVLGISVVGIGAALACGFPSVDFGPDDSSFDGSFSPTDGSGGEDGSLPDGGRNPDGCKGDPECDCDGDGDKTPACGGNDCDDHDERVRSTQTEFIDAPSNRAGDWNCDGKVERESDGGVTCTRLLDAGWAADASIKEIEAACVVEGFAFDPGCGEVGDYVHCEKGPGPDNRACRSSDKTPPQQRARGCR